MTAGVPNVSLTASIDKAESLLSLDQDSLLHAALSKKAYWGIRSYRVKFRIEAPVDMRETSTGQDASRCQPKQTNWGMPQVKHWRELPQFLHGGSKVWLRQDHVTLVHYDTVQSLLHAQAIKKGVQVTMSGRLGCHQDDRRIVGGAPALPRHAGKYRGEENGFEGLVSGYHNRGTLGLDPGGEHE
ncbi:hypothetical protein FE257_004102 [Aspergillus nanangensis]|uniref:Uncharacterized protein n=1 Tax=Aspergillus nanangensis TaxID=2582783 RepID=A0AAD4GMH4_ASPNN|nr:hypothetical protein FE257_004102 [Aspergillus nanangensis]